MSIAPPQLKPSFKFLLNAQRPAVNNSSTDNSKPKICSAGPSNSMITPSLFFAMAKVALFTACCVAVHVVSPDKTPALLALVLYYEASAVTPDREAASAAVLMLLMRPTENLISWIASILWLIPHTPPFVCPALAALTLCFPSPTQPSPETYALAFVRGLIYVAMKRKSAASCEVVLFSPSIPTLVFATVALFVLDNYKREVTNFMLLAAAPSATPLSVVVEENPLSPPLDDEILGPGKAL
jgi:hypothetical protein